MNTISFCVVFSRQLLLISSYQKIFSESLHCSVRGWFSCVKKGGVHWRSVSFDVVSPCWAFHQNPLEKFSNMQILNTQRVPISMGMDGERAIVVASRVFELCWIMICHAIDPCRHISAHVLLVTQLCCQLWKQIDFDLKLSSFFFPATTKIADLPHFAKELCCGFRWGFEAFFHQRGGTPRGLQCWKPSLGSSKQIYWWFFSAKLENQRVETRGLPFKN